MLGLFFKANVVWVSFVLCQSDAKVDISHNKWFGGRAAVYIRNPTLHMRRHLPGHYFLQRTSRKNDSYTAFPMAPLHIPLAKSNFFDDVPYVPAFVNKKFFSDFNLPLIRRRRFAKAGDDGSKPFKSPVVIELPKNLEVEEVTTQASNKTEVEKDLEVVGNGTAVRRFNKKKKKSARPRFSEVQGTRTWTQPIVATRPPNSHGKNANGHHFPAAAVAQDDSNQNGDFEGTEIESDKPKKKPQKQETKQRNVNRANNEDSFNDRSGDSSSADDDKDYEGTNTNNKRIFDHEYRQENPSRVGAEYDMEEQRNESPPRASSQKTPFNVWKTPEKLYFTDAKRSRTKSKTRPQPTNQTPKYMRIKYDKNGKAKATWTHSVRTRKEFDLGYVTKPIKGRHPWQLEPIKSDTFGSAARDASGDNAYSDDESYDSNEKDVSEKKHTDDEAVTPVRVITDGGDIATPKHSKKHRKGKRKGKRVVTLKQQSTKDPDPGPPSSSPKPKRHRHHRKRILRSHNQQTPQNEQTPEIQQFVPLHSFNGRRFAASNLTDNSSSAGGQHMQPPSQDDSFQNAEFEAMGITAYKQKGKPQRPKEHRKQPPQFEGSDIRPKRIPKRKNRRMTGAGDADIEDYPYVVAILKLEKYWCAGAILNEKVVITTASCMWRSPDYRYMKIRAGSRNAMEDGQVTSLRNVYLHPDWDMNGLPDVDVSLIRVNKEFRFTDSVHAVDLPNRHMSPPYMDAWVTSWGSNKRTGEFDDLSLVLLQVYHAKVIQTADCNATLLAHKHKLTKNFICLEQKPGAPCTRDVGAPAVSDGVLWGLASWGLRKFCGHKELPAMFTSLSATCILDFISVTINDIMSRERTSTPFPSEFPQEARGHYDRVTHSSTSDLPVLF